MVNVSSPPPKKQTEKDSEKQKRILEEIKRISEQYRGIAPSKPKLAPKPEKSNQTKIEYSEKKPKTKEEPKPEKPETKEQKIEQSKPKEEPHKHKKHKPLKENLEHKPEPKHHEELHHREKSKFQEKKLEIKEEPKPEKPETKKSSLPSIDSKKDIKEQVIIAKKKIDEVRNEVAKLVVGQKSAVNHFLLGLLANGHVLVEGVPGIAKTLIVRCVAAASGCQFGRIQFTPDLLPTDIVGVSIYAGDKSKSGRRFEILRGPIFNNFILADEINRAPPKVQSALLEAMQEKQVTIGRKTLKLNEPFFVFATQNPIEQSGVYTLPEAQLDRFLFKIYVTYPNIDDEQQILESNITVNKFGSFDINPVLSPEEIIEMQKLTKKIYLNEELEKYIVRLVDATRYPEKYGLNDVKKYIDYGSSPRGSIGLFIGAKATALMNGRNFVLPEDIIEVAKPVLRHRVILTYEGQAEGYNSDKIIEEILKKVPAP